MLYKSLILILTCLVPITSSADIALEEKKIKEIITAMDTVLSGQNPRYIKAFYNKFTSKDFSFSKTTHVENTQTNFGQVTYNKGQYTHYLNSSVNKPSDYMHNTVVNNISITDSKKHASTNITVKERFFVNKETLKPDDAKIMVTARSTNNCNIDFILSAGKTLINKIFCKENITIK